jgi:hypothetical protein
MTFAYQIKNKYKVTALEGPSTGHHNAANVSQMEAIDSFMHYILKKDAASAMAADTATYIAEHKIPDETARAFARAVEEYARQIQPKGKEVSKPEPEDTEPTDDME